MPKKSTPKPAAKPRPGRKPATLKIPGTFEELIRKSVQPQKPDRKG